MHVTHQEYLHQKSIPLWPAIPCKAQAAVMCAALDTQAPAL